MSYIGVQPTAGQYRKLDDISGSFNGSTTTFTTQVGSQNVSAGTAQQLLVSLGGVIQNPITDYTVSTNSITFTTAPAAGLSFFAVLMGEAVNTGTPSDGVVTGAKLSAPFNYNSGLLYLDSSNNRVGIGTTSPAVLFHLSSASTGTTANSNVIATIRSQAAGRDANIQIGDGTDFGYVGALSGNLYFSTANTERARIDSSGRLLVGTSSGGSVARLQVQGSTVFNDAFVDICYNGSAASGIASGTSLGVLRFTDQASNANIFAQIACATDAAASSGDYPGRLVFSTTADGASSPTERMRITSGGTLAVGTTGKQDTNDVSLAVGATSPATPIETQMNTTSGNYAIMFRNPNGLVGNILTSGSSTSFNTSSDYRLKENVVPLTGAFERLNQLQVHRFNFIADPSKTFDGFLAHEVQTVVPECVTGTKDEVDADGNPVYQGIDQSKLVPLLTAALQEAVAKIESLEARLTAAGI